MDDENIWSTEPAYPWVVPDDPINLPIPGDTVGMFTYVWIKGQGASLRVVSVPGSDHAMFLYETDNGGGCSQPTPAVWHLMAIDPSVFPFKVAEVHTIDVHAALEFIQNPDAIFEFTEPGWDGVGMASFGEQVTLVPEFTSSELVFRDCVEWIGSQLDEDERDSSGLNVSGVRVADLVSGDVLADAFTKWMEEQ
jgi:hypothetical protein